MPLFNVKKKVETKIELSFPYDNSTAETAKKHAQDILNNTSLEELAMIAKVCNNPIYKSRAMKELKANL